MTRETFDWAGDSARWKLGRYLNYEAKLRHKARQDNPNPGREFLLREKPKTKFQPDPWDCCREKVTLRMAVDRYVEKVVKPTRTPENYKKQVRQLNYIIGFWDEDCLITQITAADLAAFRDSLIETGLTASTGNSYVDNIQQVLKACVELWGVLDFAPRIRRLPCKRKRMRILSYDEEAKLLKASPIHLRRLLIFLLGTGIRKRDALNLTWAQIEFRKPGEERGRIKVWATKTSWEYVVPMPKHIENMLMDMKRELPQGMKTVFTFIAKRDAFDRNGNLIRHRGAPAPYISHGADFQVARRVAGVPEMTIRCCRHTFASRLIEKNVPVYDVAKLLGHRGLATVMRYAHVDPNFFNPVIALLDRPQWAEVYGEEHQSRYEGML